MKKNVLSGALVELIVMSGLVVTGQQQEQHHAQPQQPADAQQGQGQGQGRGQGQGGRANDGYVVLGPGPSAARTPKNNDEFDAMFKQISNWGRWGPDDQLGSVNLITAAKRKQAIGLAKTGETVSLAHNPITEVAPDNPSPFQHTMNRGNTTDTVGVSFHGYAHSHLDALCHILYKGQTFNGHATADINTTKGCTKLGIDNLKKGVVSRGVLIDIPRLKGV